MIDGGGALSDVLYGARARSFSPDELMRIARGSAAGVNHLHRQVSWSSL